MLISQLISLYGRAEFPNCYTVFLKDPQIRVYVLGMYSLHARDLLCEVRHTIPLYQLLLSSVMQAYRKQFHYPKYIMITFPWYVSEKWWVSDAPSSNCTVEEREKALHHSLAAASSELPKEYVKYQTQPNDMVRDLRQESQFSHK